VTQGGVYTAPVTVPGRACHVVATSHADATRSAVAVITVSSSGTAATLEVRGRDLVDTCGSRLVIRGVDQIFGVADTAGNGPFSLGGSYTALVDQIALTGANAIRIQPQTDLPASDVDAIIGQAVQHNMVVYVSNNGLSTDSSHLYSTTWIANPDIRAVLLKPEYAAHLIIDALPEPPYDDRARWRAEAISQIAYARGLGYTHPLALMGNLYGRDLPAILSEGAAILATDPLRRVQFIWEAYWGPPYESRYGMTLTAGLNAAAAAAFPIGFGLINWSEVSCSVLLDYQANMATAQANGLSWTWWDWVLPGYRCFDLSTNGFANSLTTAGQRVVNGPNGIAATSQKACGL
jgi:mannan endo-1,4-beta-mannosidase